MPIASIIRVAISAFLLAGIYRETGIFTAFTFGIFFISLELVSFSLENKKQ